MKTQKENETGRNVRREQMDLAADEQFNEGMDELFSTTTAVCEIGENTESEYPPDENGVVWSTDDSDREKTDAIELDAETDEWREGKTSMDNVKAAENNIDTEHPEYKLGYSKGFAGDLIDWHDLGIDYTKEFQAGYKIGSAQIGDIIETLSTSRYFR